MALHFSTQCTHSVEPLSWPCSLPSSAGAAVSGTQEGNFSISQAKNLRVLLHHHSHHPPWAPFCDFLVHTQVYVHNTPLCVLHLCLVVLEPSTSYIHSLSCSLWQCQFCHGNTECFHFLTIWHWCFYVSFFSTRSNFNFFHITVNLNSFCYSCSILFYFPVHSSLNNHLIF